jgi:hypothetical protein
MVDHNPYVSANSVALAAIYILLQQFFTKIFMSLNKKQKSKWLKQALTSSKHTSLEHTI